ncbi:hypothetical protein [Wenyingzhuangia sp. 2_MG-2023]|uniref:hypothetical protein n=1 Tax=Wenyingzhuangia sp. 2_MG-2023 TaxID=3062639 RepID=UPI0026E11499|nr:hypothetical protein [Wenyingzhuangia sp. 2_MG-2023]MDO6737075.1 hypothetical protein [Wenyingzhuangia sp. 2_MG-2023]
MIAGIDPDVDKSGLATIESKEVKLMNLTFFELFDFLKENRPLLVVIEGGWLNKGNWHKDEDGTAAVNAAIGNNTGRNHETGRKIVEMLIYLEIPHKVTKPTTSKVNARLFKMITGIKIRTNQEQRDAYMLIHNIKIKKK